MNAKQIEKISKALGDPYRLKIMEAIKKEECQQWMQCAAINAMIDLAQSTVSHHVNILVDADLLIADKDGRNAKYKINKDMLSEYISFLNAFQN